MTRRRRVHRHLVELLSAQLLDGANESIELAEMCDDASHQWCPPAAVFFMRGGMISLISAIAITGNCFTKSRNHMKNQPNEPSRMAMSTQVGRYPDHCHGSN